MLFAVPALVKVLLVFALILALNRAGLHLGLALVAGAVGLGVWFEHSLGGTLQLAVAGVANANTLLLLLVVFEVIVLSVLMERTGLMRDLLDSVRALVPSRRATLAVLPMLIGLLPMPGGAAFSAPMVEAADREDEIDPVDKVAVNYWFRHVWEYWWPLYPGVLLAFELTGLSFREFFAVQAPLTVFALVGGIVFILRPLRFAGRRVAEPVDWRQLRRGALPIVIAAGASLLLALVLHRVPGLAPGKYCPMALGLVLALAWVQLSSCAGWDAWRPAVAHRRVYLLLVIMAGVKMFSAMLEAPVPDGSGRAVDQVLVDLAAWDIPPLLVVMAMPLLSGIITGIAVGFVGASFPVVVALAGDAESTRMLGYVVLAYGFGHMGMMLSPVHVCYIVTNEYFQTRMTAAYRKLWLPALGVLAGALAVSLVVL